VTYYLLLPVISLVLLVFQTHVLNLLFLEKMGLEISLVLVIYAGFRFSVLRGGLLAFTSGFILDCLTGSMTGLFTLYYVAVFFISRALSFKVYAEKKLFIMAFTFFCAFSEVIFIAIIYRIFYDLHVFANIYGIFLIQALVIGLLSPALFTLCGRLEGWFNVGEFR
jgi:rod shape-determining protein MreD